MSKSNESLRIGLDAFQYFSVAEHECASCHSDHLHPGHRGANDPFSTCCPRNPWARCGEFRDPKPLQTSSATRNKLLSVVILLYKIQFLHHRWLGGHHAWTETDHARQHRSRPKFSAQFEIFWR